MDHDERTTPDSLTGKLRELFDADADEEADDASGRDALERNAGPGAPDADDTTAQSPKRPTDPPF
jgi:hypothetical protein